MLPLDLAGGEETLIQTLALLGLFSADLLGFEFAVVKDSP